MDKLSYNDIFAFIVPTGIGASIGGYAGDASFWAQKFSSICPTIVNANVVNAACFSGINESMLYAEGWSIDEFFAGRLNFVPSKNNKIGIILDKSIPKDVLNVHINTINAVKTVYGVDVTGYEITKKEVGVKYGIDESGASSGFVNNPETLVEAGKKLLEKGAQVLAVVCLFPEDDDFEADKNYANGCGVDPVGGIESVISHYVSQKLFVPCVHAPAFEDYQIKPDLVDPRVSAEYITPTFLPCLLLGLKNAPLYMSQCENRFFGSAVIQSEQSERGILAEPLNDEDAPPLEKSQIIVHNVRALIVPSTALGSGAVMDALDRNIPVYAVEENKTVLNVTKDAFLKKEGIINIDTYENLYKILEQKYGK